MISTKVGVNFVWNNCIVPNSFWSCCCCPFLSKNKKKWIFQFQSNLWHYLPWELLSTIFISWKLLLEIEWLYWYQKLPLKRKQNMNFPWEKNSEKNLLYCVISGVPDYVSIKEICKKIQKMCQKKKSTIEKLTSWQNKTKFWFCESWEKPKMKLRQSWDSVEIQIR